jgi:hypothetical protein
MAATVVTNTLTASYWAGLKPPGYKGADLDKALKAYEAVAGKPITLPARLPALPQAKLGEVDNCIKELQAAIAELQKTQALLKQVIGALQAVQGAAGKTSAELTKLSKGKDVDEHAYKNASTSAGSIGGMAGATLSRYR